MGFLHGLPLVPVSVPGNLRRDARCAGDTHRDQGGTGKGFVGFGVKELYRAGPRLRTVFVENRTQKRGSSYA